MQAVSHPVPQRSHAAPRRRTMNKGNRTLPRRSPTTPTSPSVGGPYDNAQSMTSSSSAGSMQQREHGGEQREKPLYLCSPFVEAALVKGNFKTIVMQPRYVDLTEWVAVNSESRVPVATFASCARSQFILASTLR